MDEVEQERRHCMEAAVWCWSRAEQANLAIALSMFNESLMASEARLEEERGPTVELVP
jgi:hypothetical protein